MSGSAAAADAVAAVSGSGILLNIHISSVQVSSVDWLFATPQTTACQASLSITSSQSLLKLTSSLSDAIQPSHPLLSPSPPAFNLSQHQGLFKWVSSSHQMAKVLEFQLQHQSFQKIFRTISFRMDWLDLLAVQETLKSLLQHHSSKASILFFVGSVHLVDVFLVVFVDNMSKTWFRQPKWIL